MLLGWSALLAAAIAAGAAACGAMAAPPRAARLWLAASLITGAGSVVSLTALWRLTGRTDVVVAGSFIALGSLLGGFALAGTVLPSLTRQPAAPVPPGRDGAHGGSPAFIILADGQPEHYDPSVVTRTFDQLVDTDVPVPPDAIRVFAYLSERMRYRSAGMSPARPVVRSMTDHVRERLRERGFDGPVMEAWMHGVPRLADAVADAVGSGAGTVVVGLLDVAESMSYEVARAETDLTAVRRSGVSVHFTPPLWSDARLARLVASRVLEALPRGPRTTDGVVLVAEGQPWQWDRRWPASCEHTTYFLQRVRAELVAAGATEANVRVAWLDWQDPGVTEVVRHLAALGCERIIVMPAATPADTIETTLDLPAAVEQAALDPGVSASVLHAWGDDPALAAIVVDALETAVHESVGRGDAENQ